MSQREKRRPKYFDEYEMDVKKTKREVKIIEEKGSDDSKDQNNEVKPKQNNEVKPKQNIEVKPKQNIEDGANFQPILSSNPQYIDKIEEICDTLKDSDDSKDQTNKASSTTEATKPGMI